jgi:hypothetical protein
MKAQEINGEIQIINETREEAIQTFNDYLEELNVEPLTPSELIDWHIQGGETNSQLRQLARDYASEFHTEKCASRNSWRYEY